MPSEQKARPLRPRDVEELLDKQFTALASGKELEPDILENVPQAEQGLLGLNRQLSQSMPHVEPSGSYVSSLRERLDDSYSVTRAERERHARQLRAAIGTSIGALIVIGLVVQIIGSIVLLLNFIRSRRRNEQLNITS